MMRWVALLLFVVGSLVALPAEASLCRIIQGHTICLLSLQRSAKYFWEYRAVVEIDGEKRPLEVYNCRDRVRVRKDGKVVAFETNGPGELICSFFK